MTKKMKKVRKIEPVHQKVIQELQPKKRVCAYARVSSVRTTAGILKKLKDQ